LYYNRQKKQYEEEIEYQKILLSFLYNTVIGRCILKIITKPWFSNWRAKYQHSPKSKKDILPFIDKYNVKENKEYAEKNYKCFNDFFTRQHTLIIKDDNPNFLISPADSKLSVFAITSDLKLHIKNSIYDITDILGDIQLAEKFTNGHCLVFRLSVDDYHRYHFIDDGKLLYHKKIDGVLHTVRSISERYKVFAHNSREVNILDTKNFGIIAQVEVGALMVGKINNYNKKEFVKYDEKGYFEFGGSTIVIFLNENITIDKDIMEANNKGYETKVHVGEKIGVKHNMENLYE
jgi:phosphatidylserine decarboxylase